jgi:alpha-glucuronidase
MQNHLPSHLNRKPTQFLTPLLLLLLLTGALSPVSAGDEGYDLWLRYDPISDQAVLEDYRQNLRALYCPGDSETLAAIREELIRGLEGLLDRPLPSADAVTANSLVVGTPDSNPAIAGLNLADQPRSLGEEGFLIQSHTIEEEPVTVIAANTDLGALYGAFRFLRRLGQQEPVSAIDLADRPQLRYRVLNHWDSINGIVSRGYAGQSLWKWEELPEEISPRYKDYARACASVGINVTVLNGSYSGAKLLESEYIEKTAAIADARNPDQMKLLYVTITTPVPLWQLSLSSMVSRNLTFQAILCKIPQIPDVSILPCPAGLS